jgi:adenosylcobyric acid synthase
MRNVIYIGASANAGKTVFTRAHCRLLSNRGVRASPFKPVAVTSSQRTWGRTRLDFRIWLLGAAARVPVGHDNCPVQVIPRGHADGSLVVNGDVVGDVPLLAEDTPLFGPGEAESTVLPAVAAAYRRLSGGSDVVVIEGSGSCADLAGTAVDAANVFAAGISGAAAVLVAGAHAGGAVAALRGTLQEMPAELRKAVVGIALNDVRAGAAVLEKGARRLADEMDVAFLGSLPNCPIYRDIPPGQNSTLPEPEAEYEYLARFFADHIDVTTIHGGADIGRP